MSGFSHIFYDNYFSSAAVLHPRMIIWCRTAAPIIYVIVSRRFYAKDIHVAVLYQIIVGVPGVHKVAVCQHAEEKQRV